MNYKSKVLIIFLILFIPEFLVSQVRVGNFNTTSGTFKNLSKKNLNRFMNTQTTFITPKFLQKEAFENLLNQVWDVTSFKVIHPDDFISDNVKTDDVIVKFKSFEYENFTKRGSLVSFVYAFFDFYVVDKVKEKKGKKSWFKSQIGAIYFTPSVEVRTDIKKNSGNREISGGFLNFRLGYLKNYFQFFNRSLKKRESVDISGDYALPELKNMKKETLYIDSNLLYGYNAFSGEEKEGPQIEALTKDYPFEYEVIDYAKLEEKIFSEKNDFYYLMYNQINATKIISIVNGKTGEVIYQKQTGISYNLKAKDFKKIASKIKKMKR